MATKRKYTYQSYDYSFLKPKYEDSWSITFPHAVSAAARTIGFDLTEVHPMNEPTGQLYWIDSVPTTNETNDTTYEPIRGGGWEVRLNPPQPIVDEAPIATTATASTYDASSDNNSTENVLREWVRLHHEWRNRRKETVNNNRSVAYWKKCNFFKNLRNKRYGKKV